MQKLKLKRLGFTLTELLVVLSIIGVLTTAMAMAVRGAQERARGYRTQAQLDRIERILQAELLKVINERSVMQLPPVGNSNDSLGPHPVTVPGTESNNNPAAIGEGLFTRTRRFREEALRVLLLSRFPFEASHLIFDTTSVNLESGMPVDDIGRPVVPYFTSATALAASGSPEASRLGNYQPYGSVPSWLVRYRDELHVTNGLPVVGDKGVVVLDTSQSAAQVTSSEILYQVLTRIWIDGQPATALFRDSEFGDTDGDGELEVLDAWGEPIAYQLQVKIAGKVNPADANETPSVFTCSLSNYSLWMTDFTDLPFATNRWYVTDVAADSMSVSRVKAVAVSQNVEASLANAAVLWD